MNLIIYGINFFPELTGIGKYSGEMAAWLRGRGHDIRIVTAPPYYPAWRRADGYPAWRWTRQRTGPNGDIDALRCPLWVPKRPSGFKRVLHLASFAVTSAIGLRRLLNERRPDAVLVVAPTLFCMPATAWLARRHGVPVWVHVQDLEVDAMLGLGLLRRIPGLERFALAFERWALSRAQRVTSIAPSMAERLLMKGVPPARCGLFPNWVDIDFIRPLPRPNAVRAELGLAENDVLVLYSGNMGEKQGLETVIAAARLLSDNPRLHFLLAGDGSARSRLEAMADGLQNLRWLPLQPVERLNLLLNAADLHVLPQRADAADLVMPSKLTGMLASGKAVVGTAAPNTELGKVLEACGHRTVPDDPEALARALRDLAQDEPRRERLGRLGRSYAEANLSVNGILERFEADALEWLRLEKRLEAK